MRRRAPKRASGAKVVVAHPPPTTRHASASAIIMKASGNLWDSKRQSHDWQWQAAWLNHRVKDWSAGNPIAIPAIARRNPNACRSTCEAFPPHMLRHSRHVIGGAMSPDAYLVIAMQFAQAQNGVHRPQIAQLEARAVREAPRRVSRSSLACRGGFVVTVAAVSRQAVMPTSLGGTACHA